MSQQLAPDFDVEEVLGKLSMSAKIKLLGGKGWWHTEPISESGIPSMRFSDGDWCFNTREIQI
jgi:beta-glucosidase